ncbi:MAG: carboxylesterase family protein [Candidatus Cryosericum sp.]
MGVVRLSARDDCLIAAKTGVYRGGQVGEVQVFKGIRYALPPAGDLRFRLPVPVSLSDKTIDARSFSPVAPQPGRLSRFSGPDCLSLNIWRNTKADGSAPVLFYIHGGMFMRGSGREAVLDGTLLARDWNIVVVTINYRLGMLGFVDLSSLDSRYVANPGLHDAVLALQWTHDNIAAFGGDPANITVVGESAGGSLVSLLPMLDDAAPLLNRLVMMSGIPASLLPAKTEERLVQCFLEHFHIRNAHDLSRLSDGEIVAKTSALIRKSGLGSGTFQPTVDGQYLKAFPTNLIRHNQYRPVPMLIGNTRDELSVMGHPLLREHWDLQGIIDDGVSHEDPSATKSILSLYAQEYGKKEARIQLVSDMIIRTASLFYAEAASRTSQVWLYRFDLRPAAMRLSGLGAVHSSDLPLFFGNLLQGIGKVMFLSLHDLPAARQLSHEMQADVVRFMKDGTLPWARAFTDGFIAKCYDVPVRFDEPIPLEIYRSYQQTTYYAISMQ